MAIHYFNALAGSGKTYALARHADRIARRGAKVLFVQPTKALIDQTIQHEISPLDPTYPVTPIHGGSTSGVVQTLADHFKKARRGGEIVFITHSALLLLPYAHQAENWTLIVDEVLAVDVFKELKLSESHALLTDFLDLVPGGAAYGELTVRGDER